MTRKHQVSVPFNRHSNLLVELLFKEYLHSWESLVAEFGGSLGLFLGFSFINLWEWLEMGIGLLRQLKLFKKVTIDKNKQTMKEPLEMDK